VGGVRWRGSWRWAAANPALSEPGTRNAEPGTRNPVAAAVARPGAAVAGWAHARPFQEMAYRRRLAHHASALLSEASSTLQEATTDPLSFPGDGVRWASFAERTIDVPASQLSEVGRDDPLRRLARGDIPAIILRNTLPEAECNRLLQRCYAEGQIPPSFSPFLPCVDMGNNPNNTTGVEPLLSTRMKDGGGGGGSTTRPGHHQASADARASRTDVGYSLGTGGNDPTTYWSKCTAVHQLYGRLLEGVPARHNALHLMYGGLQMLGSNKKRVVVAHEQDGRQYGPAIIRIHKPETGDGVGHTYVPHYDSVRRREQRTGFEVFRYDVQLAGILVLQAPDRIAIPGADTGDVYYDSILHNIPATELPARRLTQSTQLSLGVLNNGGPTSGMDCHPPAFRQFCRQHPVAKATTTLKTGNRALLMCVHIRHLSF
jgi:hypothetical protein